MPNTKANKLVPVVDGTAGTPIELQDARINSDNAVNGDVLTYNSTNQVFEPSSLPIPTHRTINHEQLTDSSLGDINIHDGFYFPNAVQDYDGNWYGAVVVGDQVWLGENLRTTCYNDGTTIVNGGTATSSSTAYYYNFTSSEIPLEKRGLLYNWKAVMKDASSNNDAISNVQGIAPTGWHIPSYQEVVALRTYVNNQNRYKVDGTNQYIAKSLCATEYIVSDNSTASPGNNLSKNNATGFSAIPGARYINSSTGFSADKQVFYMWTCTQSGSNDSKAYNFYLSYNYPVFTNADFDKTYATSVRCVSDLTPVQFRNWYINQYGSLQHHLPQEISAQVNADWNATSGAAKILNKPTIPTVPTNVGAFTNDVGYLTQETDPIFSAWDKDYNDLTNTPVGGNGIELKSLVNDDYNVITWAGNESSTYINTGISMSQDDIEMELIVKPTIGSWYIWQTRPSGGLATGIAGSATNDTILFVFCGTTLTSGIRRYANTSYKYLVRAKAKNGNMSLYVKRLDSGVYDIKTGTYTYTQQTLPLYMFGNQRGDRVTRGNYIYSAKMWLGGKLVLDYVPVMRKSDDAVMFFDTRTQSFITPNSGSLYKATADYLLPTPLAINAVAKGITIYSGSSAPASVTGDDGDIYIQEVV